MFDEHEGPRDPQPQSPSRRTRGFVITGAVLLLVFFGLTTFASLYTDRLWFRNVGFGNVFTTLFWTKTLLFVVFGLLMALVSGLNMAMAFRYRPFFHPQSPEQGNLDRYREVVTPMRRWLLIAVSALLGVFAGTSGSGQWRSYLLWRHGVPFGRNDAFFGKDIGFYVFDLPWLHYLVDSAMAFLFVALLMAALVHYLYGGIRLQTTQDRLSGAAQAQLSVLLGLFVLAKAADYWLDRFDLVSNGGGLVTGMTYTDDHAVLPAKNILMFIALICAVLFIANVWRRTWLLPTVGLGLLMMSAILLGMIWPGIVQQFQVKPSEPNKEAPYIRRNIEATRSAYDLSGIDLQSYTGTALTGDAKAETVAAATSSLPVVDPQLVHDTFEQLQQVRAYYSVAHVLDVDHYRLNGTDRALVLGVRELDQAGINAGDRNWSNLHTVYTHGNGVIAAYANNRTPDDRDVPASTGTSGSDQDGDIYWAEGQQADQDALQSIDPEGYEHRVYFGEQSPDYSVVGKTSGPNVELDLGNGDTSTDQTTTYDGRGGVAVGSLFDRMMYAVKFGEPNFLLSSRVNDNSKVLYVRHPRDRVEQVAPWLTVDSDPYPAVIDGRIQWILDGYTTTDEYPQSQSASFDTMINDSLNQDTGFGTLPTDEINYMRNAVKATVDAYDGTVHLYEWDDTDPILKAWEAAFPHTVEPKADIPSALLEHLRYPEDLFKVQRYQFARYHVTDALDFYQGNDRWTVPADPESPTNYQPPYRLFVNDDGIPTWSLTSVFVPYNKDNLAAFMSVDSDATDSTGYGKIQVLQLPNAQTPGPGLITNEMSNDDEVRQKLLSFNAGDTKPSFGNLLTLPVDGGLMYVQPIYGSKATASSYPILQYVTVSYDNSVGIGKTLTEAIGDALHQVISDNPPPDTNNGGGHHGGSNTTPSGTVQEQIDHWLQRAQQAFDNADRALREGDSVTWAQQVKRAQSFVDKAVALADRARAGTPQG